MVQYYRIFNAIWSSASSITSSITPTAAPTAAPTATPSTYLRASTVMQGSDRFYPSDGGLNECLLDDGSQVLPEGAPLFDTLNECCDSEFRQDRNGFLGIIKGPSSQ